MTDDTDTLAVEVWRGDARGGGYVAYAVPRRESQTVLDVVTWIQQNAEPALAYRFACRVGMCGSCAMTVNGAPRWTCRTHVRRVAKAGRLRIAPLRNLPVIRDLAADTSALLRQAGSPTGAGALRGHRGTRDDRGRDSAETPEAAADAGIECYQLRRVCYRRLDTVGWRRLDLGRRRSTGREPLLNDARDGGQAGRLKAVSGGNGCANSIAHQAAPTCARTG